MGVSDGGSANVQQITTPNKPIHTYIPPCLPYGRHYAGHMGHDFGNRSKGLIRAIGTVLLTEIG